MLSIQPRWVFFFAPFALFREFRVPKVFRVPKGFVREFRVPNGLVE